MCKPLCDSQDISYLNCIPVGADKAVVIIALWRKQKIILKAKRFTDEVNQTIGPFNTLKVENFRKKVYTTVFFSCQGHIPCSCSQIACELCAVLGPRK